MRDRSANAFREVAIQIVDEALDGPGAALAGIDPSDPKVRAMANALIDLMAVCLAEGFARGHAERADEARE